MQMIATVLGAIARVALWLAATCMILMTAFVGWQVWGRYVLNDSPNWTEALSILLMSWFILLGAAVGTREGFHLSFDLITHLVPRRAKVMMDVASDLVVLIFGAGMVVYGGQLALGTFGATIPVLHISVAHTYLPVVVGGALVAIFSLERLARRAAGLRVAATTTGGHGVTEV